MACVMPQARLLPTIGTPSERGSLYRAVRESLADSRLLRSILSSDKTYSKPGGFVPNEFDLLEFDPPQSLKSTTLRVAALSVAKAALRDAGPFRSSIIFRTGIILAGRTTLKMLIGLRTRLRSAVAAGPGRPRAPMTKLTA